MSKEEMIEYIRQMLDRAGEDTIRFVYYYLLHS